MNSFSSLLCLEWICAAGIPVIIFWCLTPTNILNSGPLWKMLEYAGLALAVFILFAGIPVGVKGLKAAKKTQASKAVDFVLPILSLTAGIIELGALILIFCAVLFGGVSV